MSAEEVARAHYEGRRRLTSAISDLARRAWSQVNPANLVASWSAALPQMTVGVAGAQLAAARMADSYVADALDGQGLSPDASAAVVPDALAGIASDGRPLASLLLNPIFTTLTAIGSGADVDRAMASGFANLDMIARTQVADAGRAADQVALAAHEAATGYTRHLTPPSCSRCVLLAGRFYRFNAGFERHPNCDCVHVPGTGDDSLLTNPRAYFDSLSEDEQDKAFTKAGAAAIREGADMGRVVNARRGMYTAGGKHFTTDATTKRGINRRARLMPDQIFIEAGGDRAEALRLLERHGYIRRTTPRLTRNRVMEPVPETRRIAAPPSLADRVRAGVVSRDRLGGGLSALTERVTLSDGTVAVYKRAPDDLGVPAVFQQDAEELGALVAQVVGLQVPEIYRASSSEVYMTLMPGTVGAELDEAVIDALRASGEGARMGLADLLMGNNDRNDGNFLADRGRLGAIDHGGAFQWDDELNNPDLPSGFRDRWWHPFVQDRRDWRDNPLSGADVRALRNRLEALRPQFERLGRADWFAGMMRRLDAIAAHASGRGLLS